MRNKILISVLLAVLLLPSLVLGQTEIRPDQIRGGVYTKAETDSAIANATASVSVNQIVSAVAGEDLTVGSVVSLVNNFGTVRAYKNNLSVSNTPNGAEFPFNSAATTYCSAVALDSSRFIVVFVNSDNRANAIVGTVSGSSISWGALSNDFENVNTSRISTCKINTDRVLACYEDDSGLIGRMVVLSISSSTVVVGTPANFESNGVSYCSVTQLDINKAIVCYTNLGGNFGCGKVITINSTTPSAGSSAYFNAAATAYISCSALSATSAIVAFSDGGDNNYGHAKVLTISGTTIDTSAAEYTFKSVNATNYITTCAIDGTSTIIAYNDTSTGKGNALVTTNSSGVLSFGSECEYISSGGAAYNSLTKINSTTFLLASKANSIGTTFILNKSGTELTKNTGYIFDNSASSYISACFLSSNISIVSYADGTTQYGTSAINTWATTSYDSIAGVSQSTYTSGQTASILLHGTQSGYSNLIQGATYFVGLDYGISTVPVSLNGATVKVGEAINSSTLFVH